MFITSYGHIRRMFAMRFAIVLISSATLGAPAAAQSSALQAEDYSKPAAKDWPMVGGDWSNTRYSALTQINKQNVRRLGAAWVSKLTEGATSRSPPVAKNGLVFVTAGQHVYTIDAKTGQKVWSYNTVTDTRAADVTLAAGPAAKLSGSRRGIPNWKGVGTGGGLVFVGLTDGYVIALRQGTGELVWRQQTGIDEPKVGQWAAVAPTYSHGLVFTGLSDGDHYQRGRLAALDTRTGQHIWQMFSVPDPGEPGNETWPSFNDAWRSGGGGVWTSPPVDPELGLVYFTTGNAVPTYAGDWRPGTNLYTCSVLAVDLRTGKLRWYYQLVHHDVFEADLGTPLILYDTRIGRKLHKALAVLRPDGYLFQLNRETGKPLLPIEERPVPQLASQMTSATQPFPIDGESILMSCEDWRKEGIPAGFVLGCMWTPPASPSPSKDPQNVLAPSPSVKGSLMAYSPQTGYFYAQGASTLHWPRRSQDPYFLNGVGAVPGLKVYGELAAIDSRTGRIAWKKRTPVTSPAGNPLPSVGSPLVTAGGLLFRNSGIGIVEAYDAQTGDVVWQFQTGAAGGSPAATYETDGEQHVVLSMGPEVWAFKLGGSASTAMARAISGAQEEFPGPLVDTDQIETTSLHHSLIGPGTRYFLDEYTFNPYRALVKAGTRVLFVNNGIMRHEITALDRSWGTGPLSATQEAWITFDKPGQYTYICKEHPWSYGQIIVVAESALSQNQEMRNVDGMQSGPGGPAGQVIRGKEQFNRHCSVCHGENLSGRAAAPALSGRTFALRWENAAVADLFDSIRLTMPQPSPGSLERHAYLDIVAYLLQVNGLPTGPGELRDSPEALQNQKIWSH